MRRKKEEMDEVRKGAVEEDEGAELSEKEIKKRKQREGIEKRKNLKRKDKVARWGGIILLGLFMFIGFLLWVAGEMKQEVKSLNQDTITPFESQKSSVIVK